MLIQILGTGCPKCKQLAESAAEAVRMAGLDCRIEKVTNLNEIAAFGVMTTPGLVIAGKVESAGKVLEAEKIKELLLAAAANGGTDAPAPAASQPASGGQGVGSCGCSSKPAEEPTEAPAACGCGCGGSGAEAKKCSAGKIVILLLVAAVVVVLLVMKNRGGAPLEMTKFLPFIENAEGKRLPRMLEFGSTTCVPCKMMEPVLHSLQTNYLGKLSVEFYNVEFSGDVARTFKVSMIPTQVFLDPEGKELFRHEGYFPEEDILKKWAELGYKF